MWTSSTEILDNSTHRVSLRRDRHPVSYAEVIEAWQHDEPVRDVFTDLLEGAPFPAFFWETPPITRATADRPFECALLDSPFLAAVEPDPSAFAAHFGGADDGAPVAAFPNLGGDAFLVAPCPVVQREAYPHLAAFCRGAPRAQQHALWQRVGLELAGRLGEQPIWLSTAGTGVYWLHVRLDSYPKYYGFAPYRRAP